MNIPAHYYWFTTVFAVSLIAIWTVTSYASKYVISFADWGIEFQTVLSPKHKLLGNREKLSHSRSIIDNTDVFAWFESWTMLATTTKFVES